MIVQRERTVEIRWHGDAQSEVLALGALGYPWMQEANEGMCERWMRVPVSKLPQVCDAIEQAGGRVFEGTREGRH